MKGNKKQEFAYVSIVCSRSYLIGLVAMYVSLKRTGTVIPLYALIPNKLMIECSNQIQAIRNIGINVLDYHESVPIPQELIDRNKKNGDKRFSYTFDKLKIFDLLQFKKIVFLDSDIYILQNLDRLFEMHHMSAMVAGKSYPGNEDWVDLTSGIMTVVPQKGLLEQLEKIIPSVCEMRDSCGDQDVLQAYYKDWALHPELDMGEKYGVMASYATYYEDTLGYYYSDDIDDPKAVAIIHFAGEKKPWMHDWSVFSVMKQELELIVLKMRRRRNTRMVLLEYNQLVRKARRIVKL